MGGREGYTDSTSANLVIANLDRFSLIADRCRKDLCLTPSEFGIIELSGGPLIEVDLSNIKLSKKLEGLTLSANARDGRRCVS